MEKQTSQLSVRLLVLLLALFMVFLLIGRPAEADSPVPTMEYVVEPGDTLWEIARSASLLDSDLREVVLVIQDLNNLATSMIQPGQVLLVPDSQASTG